MWNKSMRMVKWCLIFHLWIEESSERLKQISFFQIEIRITMIAWPATSNRPLSHGCYPQSCFVFFALTWLRITQFNPRLSLWPSHHNRCCTSRERGSDEEPKQLVSPETLDPKTPRTARAWRKPYDNWWSLRCCRGTTSGYAMLGDLSVEHEVS